jgi:hypothetical protein
MPAPLAKWRYIPVPTRADADGRDAKPYKDLVGSYLCSVGLSVLNSRHLKGFPPLDSRNEADRRRMAIALQKVAVEVFGATWDDLGPGDPLPPVRYRLDRVTLLDGIPKKALWVLQHWDPEKVEGRSKGGRHGSHDGTRKGKVPRWTPGLLAPFADLPTRERKAAAIAALGCSESTYFDLWKRFRERQARNEVNPDLSYAEPFAELLPGELRASA